MLAMTTFCWEKKGSNIELRSKTRNHGKCLCLMWRCENGQPLYLSKVLLIQYYLATCTLVYTFCLICRRKCKRIKYLAHSKCEYQSFLATQKRLMVRAITICYNNVTNVLHIRFWCQDLRMITVVFSSAFQTTCALQQSISLTEIHSLIDCLPKTSIPTILIQS